MTTFKLNRSSILLFLVFLIKLHLSVAQKVPFAPTTDCSSNALQYNYTACVANDYTKCCYEGLNCCGGACCDDNSVCLNVGTGNEYCCSTDDPTLCGELGSGTSTGAAPGSIQSVLCTTSDAIRTYNCPVGTTCDLSTNGCDGTASSVSAIEGSSSTATTGSSTSSASAENTSSSSSDTESASTVATSSSADALTTTAGGSTVSSTPSTTSSHSGSGSRNELGNGFWFSFLTVIQFVLGYLL